LSINILKNLCRHGWRHLALCKIFDLMAHNVKAVGGGLAARIKKCVAFSELVKCGGVLAWE
jgi:hypothetical protein